MTTSLEADPILAAAAAAAGRRPEFTGEPMVERLYGITLALVSELAVTRERLDTVERLLQRGGAVDRLQFENFEPTTGEAAERGRWHQEYLARVFRVLLQDSAEAASLVVVRPAHATEAATEPHATCGTSR
jgi:hypothetical protein